MTPKEKLRLLEILGYKPKKVEKTASLVGVGKALKGATLGTAIGASVGISKGYSKISENPNMSNEDKGYHAVLPTVAGATAGALTGGVAIPKAKKSFSKAMNSVKGLFKTSEFLDELVMIKSASMNIPSEDEIEESKNIADDSKINNSNGEHYSIDKTLDSDYTLQNARERRTDISDFGPNR